MIDLPMISTTWGTTAFPRAFNLLALCSWPLTTIVINEERKRASHQFATPQARDYRTGQIERWENPERSWNLNDQVGGSLNADWVEWLMGFPTSWTVVNGWKNQRASRASRKGRKTEPQG
jgi:hypothetical protein